MQVAERWILARLRNRTFFSLDEANNAIWLLLREFNERSFQKRPGSRHSHYLAFNRPAMQPLSSERFVFATWKKVRQYHRDLPPQQARRESRPLASQGWLHHRS